MQRLVIYNLETNLDSEVLAAAHDWIESFASQIQEVVVYSTHVGRHELPSNVEVFELGGGTFFKKLVALSRLIKSFCTQIRFRKELIVFHHMSTRTLLVAGPLYRIAGVKQGLWYSHSKNSLTLKISQFFANVIFSSTSASIPLNGEKLRFIGHGIKTQKFVDCLYNAKSNRQGIVLLGRIAPIKNIELAIDSISKANIIKNKKKLTCIGPTGPNAEYQAKLIQFAKLREVELSIKSSMPYKSVPNLLCEFDSLFTATPNSVDKVAIEGALSGCFIITNQKHALELTGMDKIFEFLGKSLMPSIEEQISIISSIKYDEAQALRKMLSLRARELNDLNQTTSRILAELRNAK